MLDEIQTGMGRTGSLFAFQQLGVLPDVMSLAKALGNGVPIGATLARGKAAEVFAPGNHGTTFGGNPLACAAGLAVINRLNQSPELIATAKTMGQYLHEQFSQRFAQVEAIKVIRSMGLMIGIQLDRQCADLVKIAMEKHQILINVTRGDTIRLLPPLILTSADADLLIAGVVDVVLDFLNSEPK
jgi:acetylornithine aminotransferase